MIWGGDTGELLTLLAKIENDNGINTATYIRHDIVAIINGDETNLMVINDYCQMEVNDFKKGVLSFPFEDLEPGLHSLTHYGMGRL